MSSEEILYCKISEIRKRYFFILGLELAVKGFFIGLIFPVILLLLNKFFFLSSIFPGFYLIPFIFMFLFPLRLFFYSFNVLDMAFFLDARAGLKERLSTAVEMLEKNISSPMVSALVKDASVLSSNIEASKAVPFIIPKKVMLYMVIASSILTGIYFIPFDPFHKKPSKELIALLNSEGKELNTLCDNIDKTWNKKFPDEKIEMTKDIKDLAKKMQTGKMTKKEALVEISSMEKKINDKYNSSKAINSSLNKIKDEINKNKSNKNNEVNKANQEEIFKKMSDKIKSGKLTDEEKSKMAKKLENELNKMPDNNPYKDDLKKLSDALKSGNDKEITKALKSLQDRASQDKLKEEQMEKLLSKLEDTRKEIGKEQYG